MKKIIIFFILMTLLGCQQIPSEVDNSKAKDTEFIEPEPSDWVEYMKPIREYMYYRTQAVINNNIEILWGKYPELENGMDNSKGINVEKIEMESLNRNFDLLDANYTLESYERIKVKTINESEVIVLVHGGIGYLTNDFDESGGEYLIEVYLEREDTHWTVVKTDEYTLPEYKEWIDENN